MITGGTGGTGATFITIPCTTLIAPPPQVSTMLEYTVMGAARITAGLLAGLYFSFAVAVMPALRGLDDGPFVDTMKRINISIVNPLFLLVFFAAPVLAATAALLVRSPVVWIAAALGVATLLITLIVNVPLNTTLAAGGSRLEFENPWVVFNRLRTLSGLGSLVFLLLPGSGTQ